MEGEGSLTPCRAVRANKRVRRKYPSRRSKRSKDRKLTGVTERDHSRSRPLNAAGKRGADVMSGSLIKKRRDAKQVLSEIKLV